MDTQSTVTTKSGITKIGKPVSPELPKVKDANVNFRDRLNDVLATEKHNLITYQIAINEMINDDLRNVLLDGRNRLQEVQVRFFNELFNIGEYQADIATIAHIADTAEVFNNYTVQLPYKQ